MAGVVKVGPWGGDGGIIRDIGSASQIKSISISHGHVVRRLVVYDVVDGKVLDIGSTGGTESKIELDADEYLTAMSGSFMHVEGHIVVTQLSLTTNKKGYGPYGTGGGTVFSLPVVDGKIINFFGRGGTYVDALGAYLGPK